MNKTKNWSPDKLEKALRKYYMMELNQKVREDIRTVKILVKDSKKNKTKKYGTRNKKS